MAIAIGSVNGVHPSICDTKFVNPSTFSYNLTSHNCYAILSISGFYKHTPISDRLIVRAGVDKHKLAGSVSLTVGPKVIPARGRSSICRAELLQEAPFTIAIGASILNTLLFTSDISLDDDDEEEAAAVSSTDARLAVMSFISCIPYFNWLSWVFALMDTGKQRYAFYALVYLAPYIRTNLSLSPEDSWLPIASIVLCIIHIQLEASITSGDLQSFNFFNEIGKRLGFLDLKKNIQPTSPRKRHQEVYELLGLAELHYAGNRLIDIMGPNRKVSDTHPSPFNSNDLQGRKSGLTAREFSSLITETLSN